MRPATITNRMFERLFHHDVGRGAASTGFSWGQTGADHRWDFGALSSMATESAALFDGSDDELVAPDSTDFDHDGTHFSVSGWLYLGAVGAAQGVIGRWDAGQLEWVVRVTAGNVVEFAVSSDGSAEADKVASVTTLSVSTWYFVTASYDGANLKLFIGDTTGAATETVTAAYTGTVSNGTGSLRMGTDGTNRLTGRMDHWGVWDAAQDATDIASVYNSGDGSNFAAISAGSTPGEGVAFWPLYEQAGARSDSIGGNHAADVGDVLVEDGYIPISDGPVDRAVGFGGTPDYGIALSNQLYSSLSSGGISFWVRTTTTTLSTIWCYAEDRTTGNYIDIEILANGKIRFNLYEAAVSTIQFDSTSAVNDGEWHHVVIYSAGSAYGMYIDNSSESLTFGIGTDNGDWFDVVTSIERLAWAVLDRDGLTKYFEGEIDEFIVLDEHPTVAEIDSLWNDSLGLLHGTVPAALLAKVLNYWNFSARNLVREKAIVLNGTTQFLSSTSSDLDPGTSDFSVEGWFKTGNTNAFRLAQKRGTGAFASFPGWSINWGGVVNKWGHVIVEMTDGSYVRIPSASGASFSDDEWHHLCLTYDNSAPLLKFYIDGVEQALGQSVGGSPEGKSCASTRSFTIGCAWDAVGTQSQFFDGELAHWYFYKGTVLSQANATALHNVRAGLVSDDARRPAGATNAWPLDPKTYAVVGKDIVGSADLVSDNGPFDQVGTIPSGIGGQGYDLVGDHGITFVGTSSDVPGIPAGQGFVGLPTRVNDLIGTWHVLQQTFSKRPEITVLPDGENYGLHFDTNDMASVVSTVENGPAAYMVIVAFDDATDGVAHTVSDCVGAANDNRVFIRKGSGDDRRAGIGGATTLAFGDATQTFEIWVIRQNGASSKAYVNGGSGTAGTQGAGGPDSIRFGVFRDAAGSPLSGTLVEFVKMADAIAKINSVGNHWLEKYEFLTWTDITS